MNKSQLIDTLAARFEGNRRAAADALEAVLDTITREVAKGEKVAITGFGSFEKKVREARMVRNPATGQQMRAKKKSVPKFTPGADLKNVVSGAKKLPKQQLSVARSLTPSAVEQAVKRTAAAAKKAADATKSTATKKSSSAAKKSSSAAKKSSSTAKKSAGAAKKTTAAKKSTAKKSAAKKSSGAAKKTSGAAKKTSAAAKSTAKKSPAKKSTAKKSTAKKS